MATAIPHDAGIGGPINIWPFIARPDTAKLPMDADALRGAAALLADLVSPVLAAYLLAPVARRLGTGLLDETAVNHSKLVTSFSLSQQCHWARALVDTGLDVMFLKGFANAHTIYPEPFLRTQGDLDVLVRKSDLQQTINSLADHGFRFRSTPVHPWGLISDASFMPLVSADGACDIDIHVHPDCYPAYRSLTTDAVFSAARTVNIGPCAICVPCEEHALVLCVTNTAKDKFDVFSIRKVIDAIVLLRNARKLDWDEVIGLAVNGSFYRPMCVFFALLDALGVSVTNVPTALLRPPGGLRGWAFRGVCSDFLSLFPEELPMTTLLWRELTLCAEPSVALYNLGLRLRGLGRPMTGLPDGVSLAAKTLPFADSSKART